MKVNHCYETRGEERNYLPLTADDFKVQEDGPCRSQEAVQQQAAGEAVRDHSVSPGHQEDAQSQEDSYH